MPQKSRATFFLLVLVAILGVSVIFRRLSNHGTTRNRFHRRRRRNQEKDVGAWDVGPWDGELWKFFSFSASGTAVREFSATASVARNFSTHATVGQRPNDNPGRTDVVLADEEEEATADEEEEATADADAVSLNFGPLVFAGHSGRWYARYPLGVCIGDCQTDDDCAGDLYCHQRTRFEASPYCTGGESIAFTADFCTWNPIYPPPEPDPTPPAGSFRLKLYWEPGYLWQNETTEREWCMIYNFDGYPGDGRCWYGDQPANCTRSQAHIGACLDGDPRQWFTFEALGFAYTGHDDHPEVLIKTMDNWCLYRHNSAIYLNPTCDPNDHRQRFFALSGSFAPGDKFELGQYTGYTLENCVTNAHHPKSGEVIEFHVCEAARAHEDRTSFWQLY